MSYYFLFNFITTHLSGLLPKIFPLICTCLPTPKKVTIHIWYIVISHLGIVVKQLSDSITDRSLLVNEHL